jgi:hypothetical protein
LIVDLGGITLYGWNNLDSDFMRQHIEGEIRQQNEIIQSKQREIDEINVVMSRLRTHKMCNTQEYLRWKSKYRSAYNAIANAQKRLCTLHKDLKKYK